MEGAPSQQHHNPSAHAACQLLALPAADTAPSRLFLPGSSETNSRAMLGKACLHSPYWQLLP